MDGPRLSKLMVRMDFFAVAELRGFNLLQLVLRACVAAVKCRHVLHRCEQLQ